MGPAVCKPRRESLDAVGVDFIVRQIEDSKILPGWQRPKRRDAAVPNGIPSKHELLNVTSNGRENCMGEIRVDSLVIQVKLP
mmetsp:Transcript_63473/g.138077  ORF Transcript_63473/g.138077 Transcript_63473/m.138077 type:complete len:82 (+) Transcript_63473:708-953(+)